MNTIPIETVEEVWGEVFNLKEKGISKLVGSMEKKQPDLIPYLMARGEEFLAGDDVGELLQMGAVVWRCFENASGGVLKPLSLDVLEEVEERCLGMLEEAEGKEETAAFELAMHSLQQPLLQTVLGYLMEGESEIHPDRQGIAFFLIKIVVDCFDQQ